MTINSLDILQNVSPKIRMRILESFYAFKLVKTLLQV